jgi:hypothetical protein
MSLTVPAHSPSQDHKRCESASRIECTFTALWRRFLAHRGISDLRCALRLALQSGDLNAIKLLFDARPPGYDEMPYSKEFFPQHTVWSGIVMDAAKQGHVSCVEFAVTHGYHWYPKVRSSNLGLVLTFSLQLFSHRSSCGAHCIEYEQTWLPWTVRYG